MELTDFFLSPQSMKLFVAAYETGSFTAAAAREHSTQPGISHHIRQMELKLDVALFVRESLGVRPTVAGHSLYGHCLRILKAQGSAGRAMQQFRGEAAETLNIGVIPSLTRHTVAPALADFMRNNPNVQVKMTESYGQTLADMVASGELHVAITTTIDPVVGLSRRVLLECDTFLVGRLETISAPLGTIKLRDLPSLALIGPGAPNAYRERIEGYCRDNEVKLSLLLEMDSSAVNLDLVRQSDWQTILPEIMFDRMDLTAFSIRRIVSPSLRFELIRVVLPTSILSSAGELLIDMITQEAVKRVQNWREVDPGR